MPAPDYPADSSEHRALLDLVSNASGVDFTAYRTQTITRRVLHRMRASGAPDLASYVARVQRDAAELARLGDALLIKTTSMFREESTFAALRESVLPALCARRATEGATSLSVWIVGCSTGEEAYSLGMCLLEAAEQTSPAMKVVMLASDADARAIEQANRGLLSRKQAADVPPALATRWLVADGTGYRISEELRRSLVFDRHDALDPVRRAPQRSVFATFDLVCCRNLLIYLREEARVRLAARLVGACEPGSVLVLGSAEALPELLAAQCTPLASPGSIFGMRS